MTGPPGGTDGRTATAVESALRALYARQSHAIDEGDADGWAETFTVDGVFASPTHGEPVHGREALRRFAADVYARHLADGVRQRHWVGSVHVVDGDADGGDGIRARAYLLIVRIGADATPTLARHVVIDDHLVADGDNWRVRQRTVHPDP